MVSIFKRWSARYASCISVIAPNEIAINDKDKNEKSVFLVTNIHEQFCGSILRQVCMSL
jgi:hypothetical protein